MITPRTTRLLRVPDLKGLQRAIAECVPAEALRARACAILVPSEGAAEELRRTLETARLHQASGSGAPAAFVLPDIVTRAGFYARLHDRIPGAPPVLTAFDREVLLRRSAIDAQRDGVEPPFNIRPGLVAELLGLYDQLRRNHKSVADFERLLVGALEPGADIDRGTARLLQQTRFLAAAFTRFETAIAESGAVDEHGLRSHAIGGDAGAYRQVIVTVADQAADPRGLWSADFDLLSRAPGITQLEVIATEAVLESGFHERLHDLLPGIEEEQRRDAAPLPLLLVPDVAATDERALVFVARDREEELAEFVRWLKREDATERAADGAGQVDGIAPGDSGKTRPSTEFVPSRGAGRLAENRGQAAFDFDTLTEDDDRRDPLATPQPATRRPAALDRIAIVFQRPLPYLYLARQIFAEANLEWQALDAMPLAAEPFAALVDVVLTALAAGFTRAATLELLRSPHLSFDSDEGVVTLRQVNAIDRFLVERKYLGGIDRLEALAADGPPGLKAAAAAARELTAAAQAPTSPAQIDMLLAFLTRHERPIPESVPWAARHLRARGAVIGALQLLRDAHAAHDPQPLSIGELGRAIRRWVEGQTFAPRLGTSGIVLLDARAAAYADLDELRVVGLTESDWPERTTRNIFYPQSLLAPLGWPSDHDRLRAARAGFQDLLRVAGRRVALSTFTLEDDAIVSPTPLLEEVPAIGLPIERSVAGAGRPRVFAHQALMTDPIQPAALDALAQEWLALRVARPTDPSLYRGTSGPLAPGAYAISRVEKFLDCPFRYFAGHVLRLQEEREEEAWMSPQERGAFVHEVFRDFFTQWQDTGHRAITPANAAEAMELFQDIADVHLESLPESDRALERTLLLGSAAAAGLAERAFAVEIEDGLDVEERLLEFELDGTFTFAAADAANEPVRPIQIRAKADRIDLLSDGTLRVIDYKLGRAPDRKRALQLPIYGVCAEQALDGRRGRTWRVSRAGYVAFKEKATFVDIGRDLAAALRDGQGRLVGAVEGIERGEFPPQPAEPYFCNWCPYPSVCRKDYVGDE